MGAISCCSNGKTTGKSPDLPVKDSSAVIAGKENGDQASAGLPECIKALIDRFKKEEKQNPPRSVYSYTYNGKTVYYVPPICCDFFSDLYDSNCKLLGYPDGGFTGRGDGSITDFMTRRTREKLIWKDERE